MRVVTGALSHETSTFTQIATTRESYHERFGFLRGNDLLAKFRDTNSPIGGFIDGAEKHGFELIPTLGVEPHPSAPTPRDLFDEILDEMLDRISGAGEIDGVLLELHGAMVVEGIDDGEGHILTAVRDIVGAEVPILAQLDIHSNVSLRMIEKADVLIGRETFPEIDMRERSRECADVLMRIVDEGLRPTMALCQIPMMWGLNQLTEHAPMSEAIAELHRVEALPGVVCGSIATCFPLADVPDMGASVYIVGDNDVALAQRCADELGAWLFERRADWHSEQRTTEQRLEEAEKAGAFPAIFSDRNDNPGGGSPGDSTGMLKAFIAAGLEEACVLYIVDPEAIAICHAAGPGANLTVEVGAKTSPLQGTPVKMNVTVVAVSEGSFRYDGPMYNGIEANMGPSAHIVQDGIHVILTTEREQPFDTALSRSLGLDPRQMRYIGVKSAAHFRAGFESWAGAIYAVGEPSVHDPLTAKIAFRKLGRKLYPLDDI